MSKEVDEAITEIIKPPIPETGVIKALLVIVTLLALGVGVLGYLLQRQSGTFESFRDQYTSTSDLNTRQLNTQSEAIQLFVEQLKSDQVIATAKDNEISRLIALLKSNGVKPGTPVPHSGDEPKTIVVPKNNGSSKILPAPSKSTGPTSKSTGGSTQQPPVGSTQQPSAGPSPQSTTQPILCAVAPITITLLGSVVTTCPVS